MGPMIHALMTTALIAYLVGIVARRAVHVSSAPLLLQLALAPPLLLLIMAARRIREPLPLRMLALLCVLLLEIGINLNGMTPSAGIPHALPGLLLPVASSVIWLGRWDFLTAMALCALGPLPMVMHSAEGAQIIQYAVYMAISVALASVLRAFMTRTLFEQFQLERLLHERATTDGLTGLLLRNRFLEMGRLALDHVCGQQQPACMLFLDADHFKQINDKHGHAAGDTALVALANSLRAHVRDADLIGRIGGEEFAMLLPGVDQQQARVRAEQLRLAVRASEQPGGPLTVSIGIAECAPGFCEGIETLLARADQAMRRAKRDGRDRVVMAEMLP
jgi:diguanylate cyclase (GGDEF)-like protein